MCHRHQNNRCYPVALHQAPIHDRLLPAKPGSLPVFIECDDLRNTHPVDEMTVSMNVCGPRSDDEIADVRSFPNLRLTIGQRAHPHEGIWCKAVIMLNDVGIEPTHGSALIALRRRSSASCATWLLPHITLARQSFRKIGRTNSHCRRSVLF